MAGEPRIPAYVLDWAAQHAEHQRSGESDAADDLRERIRGAGFELVDEDGGVAVVPAQRYQLLEADEVPDHRQEPSRVDLSVLLLLPSTAGSASAEPDTAARRRGQDDLVTTASRCLAAVLANQGSASYEVVILDDGVGGAVADWAADAARNAGISSLHLARPVGTPRARALQHRLALGAILLWLEPHVELTGDVFGQLDEAFSDPEVGLVTLEGHATDVLALRREVVVRGIADGLEAGAPAHQLVSAITDAGGVVVERELAVVRHVG